MRFAILVSLLALVLYLLRDSGYWALVVLPYGAVLWVDGVACGSSAMLHRIRLMAARDNG